MKKKSMLWAAFLVLAACILMGVYLTSRPEKLGNISQRYAAPTTATSNISFDAQCGDRLKFSLRSEVQEGAVSIVLREANGNMLHELDQAKALEAYFKLEKTGTYTLEAVCTEFVGEYSVSVRRMP